MKLLCSILVAVLMLGNIAYAEVIDDEKVLFQTVIGNDGLKIADIAEDDVITREEMVDILINLTQIQKDDIENIKFHTRDPKLHIYYYPFNDWPVEENKEKLLELTISELWKTAKDFQKLSRCWTKKQKQKATSRQ